MNPTSQALEAQVPASVHSLPLSGMPKAVGKERLAPLDPITCISEGHALLPMLSCTCLIPSLNGRRDRVQDNSEVENLRVSPPMCDFIAQSVPFMFVEVRHVLIAVRTLRDQRPFAQNRQDVHELVLLSVVFDILHELGPGNANKRIADPISDIST